MTLWYSSALYVVDLAKFRQTAAGDTLRVFYEQLSKDPNSLSNLDQVNELLMHLFDYLALAQNRWMGQSLVYSQSMVACWFLIVDNRLSRGPTPSKRFYHFIFKSETFN